MGSESAPRHGAFDDDPYPELSQKTPKEPGAGRFWSVSAVHDAEDGSRRAVALRGVIDDLTEASGLRSYAAQIQSGNKKVLAEIEGDPSEVMRNTLVRIGSLQQGAWDTFVTLDGHAEFRGMDGRAEAVSGTATQGSWSLFVRELVGAENETVRDAYRQELDVIGEPSVSGDGVAA